MSILTVLGLLLCCILGQPTLTHALDGPATQDRPLVTLEIRYHAPGAAGVVLVWGIDDWAPLPEEERPAGTTLQDGVMHTPLERRKDTFVAAVQSPAHATVDYGFLVTWTDGKGTVEAWDGKNDPVLVVNDQVLDVQPGVALDRGRAVAVVGDDPLVPQEIRYYAPQAGEVTLVWGINGWLAYPGDMLPANTDRVDGAMHTPMALQDGAFGVQVPVPAGASTDFSFLITETSNGTTTEVLDANGELEPDYSTRVIQGQAAEVWAPPSVIAALVQADQVRSRTRATLVLATLICAGGGALLVKAWFTLHPRGSQARNVVGLSRERKWKHRYDLVKELVVRDTKLRYRGSVLGIAWSLLNPLAYMLVFTFLTRRVLSFSVPNYPAFVFIGTLAWSWLQTSVTLSASAITDNRALVSRPGFPSEILPVTIVSTNLIQFLLALIVPLVYFLVRGGRLTFAALMLPLVVVPQFLITLGLGYLAATFQVSFRDTRHIVGVLFRILYFLTPIFYDASMVPERYEAIYRLNPMYHLVTAYRAILIHGHVPDLLVLPVLGIMGIILLWTGHVVFARSSPRFVEEL